MTGEGSQGGVGSVFTACASGQAGVPNLAANGQDPSGCAARNLESDPFFLNKAALVQLWQSWSCGLVGLVGWCLSCLFCVADQSERSSCLPMTILTQLRDCHSCNDERSIVQKIKKKWQSWSCGCGAPNGCGNTGGEQSRFHTVHGPGGMTPQVAAYQQILNLLPAIRGPQLLSLRQVLHWWQC